MRANRLIFLAGALGLVLMASACDPVIPSRVNTAEMRVRRQVITKTIDAQQLDENSVAVLSESILQNGNPEVSLTMPYMHGRYATAVKMGAAYRRAFAARGVTHFSVAPVIVDDLRDTRDAVLSYHGLVALPSASCTQMPGHEGATNLKDAETYQYGCATQIELGREIANPADLLGQAPRTQFNSRRNGAIIDNYMKGTPNKPLQGYQASNIGG